MGDRCESRASWTGPAGTTDDRQGNATQHSRRSQRTRNSPCVNELAKATEGTPTHTARTYRQSRLATRAELWPATARQPQLLQEHRLMVHAYTAPGSLIREPVATPMPTPVSRLVR